MQPALGGLGLDRVDHARDALADRQARGRAAQIGLHPAGRHQQQRVRVVGVACGEAAHQLVQRGFARPVDLEAALVIIGNTPLA